MLGLVERTGREFGIAVMVTSHLLGEIERVCDHLVAIDAGKLHYSGPVSAFTQQTKRLHLELDDDVPAFAERLRAQGLQVEGKTHEFYVTLNNDHVYDIVRDAAADLEAPLARMEIVRHKLEELFREASGVATEVQRD
jgi:ABC-2 type transport system ATP-binding protein